MDGRESEVKAMSALPVDRKHILSNEIPKGSKWGDINLIESE
jgi:hypothetical protein